jgi:hypothetical protein
MRKSSEAEQQAIDQVLDLMDVEADEVAGVPPPRPILLLLAVLLVAFLVEFWPNRTVRKAKVRSCSWCHSRTLLPSFLFQALAHRLQLSLLALWHSKGERAVLEWVFFQKRMTWFLGLQ